jgi:phage terminase large subunit-like protein
VLDWRRPGGDPGHRGGRRDLPAGPRQRYVWFGRYYLPEKAIEKSPIAQMSGWVRDGHIIETDGDQADFQRIEDDIVALVRPLDVREIDFDRALAAHMSQNLKRRLQPRMGKDASSSSSSPCRRTSRR